MNQYMILLLFFWVLPVVLLLLFVPRDKVREAHISFLAMQVPCWILGLTVVQLKLIEYPIRSFPYVTKACFDFEYFTFPAISVFFNLYYPKYKSRFRQFMYYFYYCSGLTVVEVITERYTDILNYISWAWYMSFVSFLATFYICHKYYVWFFKLRD